MNLLSYSLPVWHCLARLVCTSLQGFFSGITQHESLIICVLETPRHTDGLGNTKSTNEATQICAPCATVPGDRKESHVLPIK